VEDQAWVRKPPEDGTKFDRDNLLSLLSVYTTQFASYTTLLWQVPALGLAAQAFLMTIVLGSRDNASDGAKFAAGILSNLVAGASIRLMHSQRGRAINQSELAKRVSRNLALNELLGTLQINDAAPQSTSAEDVWDVNHWTYGLWVTCMAVFVGVDLAVIVSIAAGTTWFT